MVYGGKPSRGCFSCIGRRIKVCPAGIETSRLELTCIQCDGRVTGCSQCHRMGIVCPGYRSELDLKFHDQTPAILSRFRPKRPRKHKSSGSTSTTPVTPEPVLAPLEYGGCPQELRITGSIRPSLDDAALGMFYSQQVCGRVGTFEYLQKGNMLAKMSADIALAVRALGFISLSKTHSSAVAERAAIRAYVMAVRQVSNRLNSSAATEDDTLLLVLLLDRFDAISQAETGGDQSSETSSVHLAGAIAISKAKGLQQFQTQYGSRLFRHLASRNLVHSAKQGQAISADIVALQTFMSQNVEETERPTWAMSSIVSRMVNLSAEVKAGILCDVGNIVSCASQLDMEFEALLRTMPDKFAFKVLDVEGNACQPFGGRCQIYTDFRVALIWNLIRASRILLHEMIYTQVRDSIDVASNADIDVREFQSTAARSMDTINDMAVEICATVPQQVGLLRPVRESEPEMASALKKLTGNPSMQGCCDRNLSLERDGWAAKMLSFQGSAYSILWPLYVIGRCPGTRLQGLYHWVLEQFELIGEKFGIPQSLTLARSLQSRDPLPVWSVYDLLGSYSRLPEESESYNSKLPNCEHRHSCNDGRIKAQQTIFLR
jgi:hypothetical protein